MTCLMDDLTPGEAAELAWLGRWWLRDRKPFAYVPAHGKARERRKHRLVMSLAAKGRVVLRPDPSGRAGLLIEPADATP